MSREGVTRIRLHISAVNERIEVTTAGTPVPIGDVPESVVVLGQQDLESMPAPMLDDKLRQVPGFSLFRRTPSRFSNPTSQGVSLRGLGGNGASRAVVLVDGIPLTDPFGGWVYWDRVPAADLQDVELLRGGGSYLYGTPALAGVIAVSTKPESLDHFDLDLSYGNQDTPDASLSANKTFGRWNAAVAAEGYRTDGYFLLPFALRGAADTRANVRFGTGTLRLGRNFLEHDRVYASLSLFNEGRANGAIVETNGTRLWQAATGVHHESSIGDWDASIFGLAEHFQQTFGAVAPDRSAESLTRTQQVPAQEAGGGIQWSRAIPHQQLLAGFQLLQARGNTNEIGFSHGAATANTISGGEQRTVGLFGEDAAHLGPVGIGLGVRVDVWDNFAGFSSSFPLAKPGPPTLTGFPDRSETAISPHAGIIYHVTPRFGLTASAYGAFRGPTLNELYRGFRVGNVVTQANPFLKTERLHGAEGGAIYSRGNALLRANFYWDVVRDPVSNITVSVTPSLITRIRENVGDLQSRGIEVEAETQVLQDVTLEAGYRFADANVTSFPAKLALVGLEVPQVPRHVFTFAARYNTAAWVLAVQGRASSRQFEDDQNLLPLDSYFTLDTFVQRRLAHGFYGIAAIENVLDQQYMVGRTPLPTFGPPLLFRLGVRVHLGER